MKTIHRWLGLILGALISIIALSGSLLTFDRELEPLLFPESFALRSDLPPLPLQTLLERARTVLPSNVDMQVRLPQRAGRPYQFWTLGAHRRQVLVDPSTGAILAVRGADHMPFGWLFEFHSELLAGDTGEAVVGFLGIGLSALAVTGILAFGPIAWRTWFRLRREKGRFLLFYDLHRLIGLPAALVLALACVTGTSLAYSDFTRKALALVSGRPRAKPAFVVRPQESRAPLDRIVAAADAAMPGGRIGVIALPAKADKPITIRKQMPGQPHPNGLEYVHVDPYSADVLAIERLADADVGTRWFNWAYPLHTGKAFGVGHQLLVMLSGMAPAVLLASGVFTWWTRRRRAAAAKVRR